MPRSNPLSPHPSLLIVDDAPENLTAMVSVLDRLYDLRIATSGQGALDLVAAQLPDLILLDVLMPGMDGYEVLITLKSDLKTRDIPVIFVTALNTAESESGALSAGAADFIHKPINPDVVLARVQLQLTLQARERKLSDANAHLEQRVAERTAELSAARDAAETANRAKRAFLANISHEMRTPIHQMLAMASIVRREGLTTRQTERLHRLDVAGRHLSGIIDDILLLTEIESNSLTLTIENVDANALLNQAAEAVRDQAQLKGIELRIEPSDITGMLLGDPGHLRMALLSYAGNAIKFSDTGPITLRTRVVKQENDCALLRFEVEDHGAGIAAADIPRMFEMFEQADNSTTRKYGGTGVGLYIVKNLARKMGGEAGCDSVSGQGSTFWFTVWLKRP
jgi:signal transduction histidine kinase